MNSAEPPSDALPGLPPFLLAVISHLRRRRIQVGIRDVHDLRRALRAGFGLASTQDLCDLCVALWATSPAEEDIVRAAFANVEDIPGWRVAAPASTDYGTPSPPGEAAAAKDSGDVPEDDGQMGVDHRVEAEAVRAGGLGPGPLRTGLPDPGLLLVPHYPLGAREVAQAWRHLRRPVRSGPAVELDVIATVRERARRGVPTPPVVVPRRRNTVRLLLLIDQHGSMTPFHGYVDYVVAVIRGAGRIDDVLAVYFHDLPGTLADRSVLGEDPFRADLDPVLESIGPLRDGRVYSDEGLITPVALAAVLARVTPTTAVLVISDGGAARGRFDLVRLLDTVALLKAARRGTGSGSSGLAWLNPVPAGRWAGTTAGAIARHVPMYPFTQLGLNRAIDALRGRPVPVERPI